MDPDKKEKFFKDLDKTSDQTNLVIKDELGLVWEGTFEMFDNNIIEDRGHILNSEILDYKYDEKSDTFEIIIDYASLE